MEAGAESTLNEVESEEGAEERAPAREAGAEAEGEEGERGRRGERGRVEGRGRERGGGSRKRGAGAPETPGPAAEFEGLVGQNVADYLEGNLSGEQLSQIEPRTRELLEAVDLLGDRSITDPEAGALQGLTGEGLEPGAQPTGYEGEPLWLRTLASIRDITGQLGGIVGIIGLVATVAGFILSLLIPPVGAFLLTVGRFCDIAALILDAISLVLGIILTGYNLYRLKNETNPEERRRLLGMVRKDAMGTVMSAVAVATAVAPGAARVIGRSRVGRFAGRVLRSGGERIAGAATRLAAQPTRLGRTAAAVGRAGAATISGVRRFGAGVSGRFHTFFGRVRDFGLRRALSTTMAGRAIGRFGSTSVGRGIGRGLGYVGQGARALARTAPARLVGRGAAAGFGYARRGAQWLAQSRLGRWVGGSRLGRSASRVYGENLDLARMLFASSERAHHTYVGGRLRAELAEAQRGGALANAAAARPALQARLGQDFPEVNLANVHVRTNPTSGNLEFVRPGTKGSNPLAPGGQRLQPFLDTLRQNEATTINNMIAANPGITDSAILQQLNARPDAPARWTEAEVWAFRQQTSTADVLKTPHHTISVLDAPHLAYDPRYIQLANAPLVTPRGTTPATSRWTQFGTRAARRAPPGVAAPLDVPFVRTTSAAEDFARGTTTFANGRVLTPPPGGAWDPAYFRSEEFFEGLRLQDNTGVWINPHDPSQRLLFDAHFVAGHRWQTGEAGARAIFGPTVDFAGRFEGTVRRTLLDRSLKAYGRAQVRYGEDWRGREQRAVDWMLNQFSVAPEGVQGSETGAAESSADATALGTDEIMPDDFAAMPLGMESTDLAPTTAVDLGPPGPAGYGAMLPGMGLPPFLMGAEMPGTAGALDQEGPEAPPTPVLYSPQSLASMREQRIAIAEAIGLVDDYIAQAQQAESDNRLAKEAAGELKQRNVEQGEFAQGERDTAAGEQDKLTQASGAQENMAAENARASSESDRGKGEADTVQSEGENVSVEPKPEEPESRSWLERAWDATAGALWDDLIAPAVRAVRRKVNKVMQSINEFIMKMINQALGLDEIEAELNSGGQDIQGREASLTETDTGLQETQGQAAQEKERNQQTMDQADVNVADSQAMQEEAQTLLADLEAHNEMLQAEEATGRTYIVDFGSRYQPFFEQQGQMGEGETMPEASSETRLSEVGGFDGLASLPEPSFEPEEMNEESVV